MPVCYRVVRVSDATSITTKPPRVTFEFAWIKKIGVDCVGGLKSTLSIGETHKLLLPA